MINLIVLFLQYDQIKYPQSFFYLEKYLKQLKNCNIKKIIIDNKIVSTDNIEKLSGNIIKISGDNSLWEFSGWDKGIKYLKDNNIEYDVVLFVNDSFQNPAHNAVLSVINDNRIAECHKEKSFSGGRGGLKEFNFILDNYDVSTWNRSCYFLMSKYIIDRMDSICCADKNFIDKCIEKKATYPYFKKDAPVNENLQNRVINWLSDYWHSSFKFEDNWDLFRMKTLAFFNELLLTAKLKELGFNIIRIEK
jgi:hypothetical protein